MSIAQSSSLPLAQNAADLAAALAARCDKAKATATGWQACCPAHEDSTPSLSLTPEGDKVLVYCHAGCTAEAIVEAVGLTLADLFVKAAPPPRRVRQRITAVYDYVDTQGVVRHQTVRYGPVKKFSQRRPDPAQQDGYAWNLQGVDLVLYHLPAVLEAVRTGEVVYLCEGEKDAENVAALGLVATCNPLGAGKWRKRYSETLRGARVVLLPHNDTAGQGHARLVARALAGCAAGVKVVALPNLFAKGDVSDWLAAGGTRDALEALAEAAPLWVAAGSQESAAADDTASTPPPRITFALTEKKTIRLALLNVLHALKQDPAWTKSLGFDELLNDVILTQRPPYLPDTGPWRPRPVTEQDYRETALYLQQTYGFWAGSTLVGEGMTTYACRFPFHPIRDYLDGVTWDKTARLDTWLSTYCHVAATPFTRAVASKTLIAAVARVYAPGCKVDTMTILEGPQGTLKSTVWNTLASDAWFTDWLPDLHDKDAAQTLCGKWFVEFGELSNFQRSEVETVKRFVSGKQDHYRPAYGKKALTVPRQNIFVGSTNEEHYFKDQTGNRRFWPVTMDGEADIAGLVRDRDQLWAEAVVRYRQGEIWYLTGPLAQAAAEAQAARVELDDWEAVVLTYAEAHATPTDQKKVYPPATSTLRFITTADILEHGFHLENPLHWTPANTKRLGGILRRNGWKARPVWNADNTKQIKAFTKVIPPAPPSPPVTDIPAVTDAADEKLSTGNKESSRKDALVTDVTSVTDVLYKVGKEGAQCCHVSAGGEEGEEESFSLSTNLTVTAVTSVTAVTDFQRPAGFFPATNGSGPREGLGASDVGAGTERAASAPAPLPGGGFSFSTTERPPPTVLGRIGSRGANGQPLACTVCGGTARWNDQGTLRCVACWPQAQAVQP